MGAHGLADRFRERLAVYKPDSLYGHLLRGEDGDEACTADRRDGVVGGRA